MKWFTYNGTCMPYNSLTASLDMNPPHARSIKLQMACFRRYIECTPSWLKRVVCMCATTGVPLPQTSAVFYWWSNSQHAVQLQQHSGCWDLDENSIHLFLPIRLLGTIIRGVLRSYTQLVVCLKVNSRQSRYYGAKAPTLTSAVRSDCLLRFINYTT